ncbi:MAG: LIC_13387 family protein [Terriglobia bacterium]
MKPTLLYRIASIVFILIAVTHTIELLNPKQPSPAVAAVRAAMDSVHFQSAGASLSYGEMYIGFGLFVTAYLLFSAFLAWHLGGLAQNNPQAIGALGWAFFAVEIACLVLAWIYFFVGPVVASALVAVCLGWAAWLIRSEAMLSASPSGGSR